MADKNTADEVEMITLEFDDDTEAVCEFLGVFEVNGKEYAALAPEKDENGHVTDDVYIYAYSEEDDEEEGFTFELTDIEDEEEFRAAAAEFDRIMADPAQN
ncbi:MAG: DUF1292 domain-containing protein [Anaerovoracaceae bacterium]|nr:DUF1292 domain-containing protein [Anaerovoracaceae bacterium]